MPRYSLTSQADVDLDDIVQYIAKDNVAAALSIDERLTQIFEMLADKLLRRKQGELEIPYGVAIACAALIALYEPFVNHFGVNA